ncbi:MAG: AAA family ATPase [Desulfobacterales bacterium]|nr:AAA family ATPase [Desulfobacterales bacterium]
MAVNAQHYARIVHDKAVLRRLIEKANAITKRCFQEQGGTDEIIDFAEAAIFEITDKKARQAFYPLSKLIDGNIDFLEEKQKNKSLVTGVPTGFTHLDNLTSGLQNSDLIILAARPSMGKTALALNIARNAAVDAGVPVGDLLAGNVQGAAVPAPAVRRGPHRLLAAAQRLLQHGGLGPPDGRRRGALRRARSSSTTPPSLSAMEVRAKARRLKMDKNIGLIVIDYLQLMQGRAERRAARP